MTALAPSLGLLTALTEFVMLGGKVGDAGAALLAPALSRLSRLATLRFRVEDFGAAGAAALAPTLGVLTALTLLDLWGNTFGDSGAESLAPALRRQSRLANLNLDNTNIGYRRRCGARARPRRPHRADPFEPPRQLHRRRRLVAPCAGTGAPHGPRSLHAPVQRHL